jgi:hypothetical protein
MLHVLRRPLVEAEQELSTLVELQNPIERELHSEAVRNRMAQPAGLQPRACPFEGLVLFQNRAYHSTTLGC